MKAMVSVNTAKAAARKAAAETLGKEVADGDQPAAAEQQRGEPVERRQKQDQELDPHSADALAVGLARDGDGLVRARRCPEVEEELVEAAQLAAGNVEILRVLSAPD